MRVKNNAVLPFADTAQELLATYTREELEQPRAANWYEETWTGEYGRYSLARAKYAGSNNSIGQEVDWRDLKQECPPSATLDTEAANMGCRRRKSQAFQRGGGGGGREGGREGGQASSDSSVVYMQVVLTSGRHVSKRVWWHPASALSIKFLTSSSRRRRRYARRLAQSGV